MTFSSGDLVGDGSVIGMAVADFRSVAPLSFPRHLSVTGPSLAKAMACTAQIQGSHVAAAATKAAELASLASLYNRNVELASVTFLVALVYLYYLEVAQLLVWFWPRSLLVLTCLLSCFTPFLS